MKEIEIKILGVDCASCVKKIEVALANKFKKDKALIPSMDLSTGILLVEYNANTTDPNEIVKTINEAGYEASIVED